MHDDCRIVDTALKNQFVSAFDDPYLPTLKNLHTRYAMNNTMELIQHIYANYARFSATDMAANYERLRSAYKAEEPLKGLIKSLNNCADFVVASSEPVSETHIVCISYRLLA